MAQAPDLSKVSQVDDFGYEDADEESRVRRMLDRARDYLRRFEWVRGIEAEYVGLAVGDVVAVFLFKIAPGSQDVDEWIWVIDGDVPSAYIAATGEFRNPAHALDGYIGAAEEWVKAVQEGRPVERLIPLRLPPDTVNAAELQERLTYFEHEILSEHKGDL